MPRAASREPSSAASLGTWRDTGSWVRQPDASSATTKRTRPMRTTRIDRPPRIKSDRYQRVAFFNSSGEPIPALKADVRFLVEAGTDCSTSAKGRHSAVEFECLRCRHKGPREPRLFGSQPALKSHLSLAERTSLVASAANVIKAVFHSDSSFGSRKASTKVPRALLFT